MVNDEGCQNLGFRRGFLTLLVVIVVFQLYYLNHDNVTWYAKDRIRSPIIYKEIHEIQINNAIEDTTRSIGDTFSEATTMNNVSESKKPTTTVTVKIAEKPYIKRFEVTYDKPSSYQGPIVEGWPPSKDRSVSKYLSEEFTTLPIKEKLTNLVFVVIVQSRPAAFDVRKSCRETWGAFANEHTSVLFLFGEEENINTDIKTKIKEEQARHGDIIQINGFMEHYNNLTLKTLYTLKLFLKTDIFISTTPNYLMKVDDDTFVNLPLLYSQLTNDPKYKTAKQLLMGNCFCNHPKRNKVTTKGKYVGKWQVPVYMYNGENYPNILSGSGYVLSRSAAVCLYEEALNTPYFHLEDVHVTGFAAENCGIDRINNPGFYPGPGKKTFDKNKDILAHYVTSEWRTKFASILRN